MELELGCTAVPQVTLPWEMDLRSWEEFGLASSYLDEFPYVGIGDSLDSYP
jgi:hypothetical protein